MREDIRLFKEAGADGVVFGILNPDGTIDTKRSKELIALSRPMQVTFHRAFDMTPNAEEALETLIAMGVDRVLTSGQEASVMEGLPLLKKLVDQGRERIIVMPGAGISERNFAYVHEMVGASEYHVFVPAPVESKMQYRPGHIYMGGLLRQPEFDIFHTDEQRVNTFVEMKGAIQ